MALVSAFLRLDMRRKYGSRALGAPPAAALLARLGELLDIVDAALADSGWLAGPAPSVADFALYGWLVQLDGLDGWHVVQARQRVARLMQTLGEASQPVAAKANGGASAAPLDEVAARRAESVGPAQSCSTAASPIVRSSGTAVRAPRQHVLDDRRWDATDKHDAPKQ